MLFNSETLELMYAGGTLGPGCIVNDPNITIGVKGNTNLRPQDFNLVQKDLEWTEIRNQSGSLVIRVECRGKSGFIVSSDHVSSLPPHEFTNAVIRSLTGKDRDRHRDHVYLASVGDIQAAGWSVVFAPLAENNNYGHVLIAPPEIPPDYQLLEMLSVAFMRVIPR